jgi:hypothetical protein
MAAIRDRAIWKCDGCHMAAIWHTYMETRWQPYGSHMAAVWHTYGIHIATMNAPLAGYRIAYIYRISDLTARSARSFHFIEERRITCYITEMHAVDGPAHSLLAY